MGMGMMIMAIAAAKQNNMQYIYLGSAQRPTDIYKLQFAGLEWFDGEKWNDDMKELKEQIKSRGMARDPDFTSGQNKRIKYL